MGTSKLKIKKQLLEQEKVSYAMDHIVLPEGGIDCSEGCNPYGFPPECEAALRSFDATRLGPYPHSQALYEAIGKYWQEYINVERGNILLADGSMSALYIVNNIFDTHDAAVLGVSPQFTDYYMHAAMIGIEYIPYQLDKSRNYRFDTDEFIAMIRGEKGCGTLTDTDRPYNFIYIDNPNNPTGQCIDISDVERIVAEALQHNITIIIDEAYGDFMPKQNSAVQLCEKYPNLSVIKTMSKGYGLAGMRVGYIIAHKELIGYMNKMTNPYMVGELTREIAAAALECTEFVESSKADFKKMKSEIKAALGCSEARPEGESGSLHIAETLDTSSICLLYHDNPEIELNKEFFGRGVLAVDGNDFKGLDSTSVRVRMPKLDEFPVLLRAIQEINKL